MRREYPWGHVDIMDECRSDFGRLVHLIFESKKIALMREATQDRSIAFAAASIKVESRDTVGLGFPFPSPKVKNIAQEKKGTLCKTDPIKTALKKVLVVAVYLTTMILSITVAMLYLEEREILMRNQ
jgi:hypothetical protein